MNEVFRNRNTLKQKDNVPEDFSPLPPDPYLPGRGAASRPPDQISVTTDMTRVPDIGVTLRLSPHELFQAAQVGVTRRIDNLRRLNVSEPHGTPDEAWYADITGACGELVVAKFVDRFWSGQLGNYKARDAGPVQVRTTRYTDGHLLLYDTDVDDHPFVLVFGEAPEFTMAGWLYAREGKLPLYARVTPHGKPAYWVPQRALKPMASLKDALGG